LEVHGLDRFSRLCAFHFTEVRPQEEEDVIRFSARVVAEHVQADPTWPTDVPHAEHRELESS